MPAPAHLSRSYMTHKLTDALLLIHGAIDPSTTDESDLNDWWTNEHLPERLHLPGFQHARRYKRIPLTNEALEKPEYLALYSVSNLSNLTSDAYLKKLNNPTSRTKHFMPCLGAMKRIAANAVRRVTVNQPYGTTRPSDAGKYIGILQFDTKENDLNSEDLSLIVTELLQHPDLGGLSEVLGVTEDVAATTAGNKSKSYEGVGFAEDENNREEKGDAKPTIKRSLLLIELRELSEDRKHSLQRLYTLISNITDELTGSKPFEAQTFKLIANMHEDDLKNAATDTNATSSTPPHKQATTQDKEEPQAKKQKLSH